MRLWPLIFSNFELHISKSIFPPCFSSTGLVTHATDRLIWCLRDLTTDQKPIATLWLDTIDKEVAGLVKAGTPLRGAREVLALTEEKTVEWDVEEDARWARLMGVEEALVKA